MQGSDFDKPIDQLVKSDKEQLTAGEACPACRAIRNEMVELKAKLEQLEKANADLRERLNIDSNNSSQPPSRDRFKKSKPQNKKASGRKRGGQPGHPGNWRKMTPLEQVTEVVECKPALNCACGGRMELSKKYLRHQVYDIPPITPLITEYQLYSAIWQSEDFYTHHPTMELLLC